MRHPSGDAGAGAGGAAAPPPAAASPGGTTTTGKIEQSGSKSISGGGDGNSIIIHVFDEARGTRKDFSCDLPLLLREMRYFRSHLSGKGCIVVQVECKRHL